ncbi:hypothetical protein KIL84_013176 [Mauremys mutica]|uniref:Uncharacterized protein n=1 Tax=Mauremys mutica TaxID=74926 RepID=A0A9D4AU36_9SAUR|nr:hypothetical protein KIL84_013176 [Mauremys mutica]
MAMIQSQYHPLDSPINKLHLTRPLIPKAFLSTILKKLSWPLTTPQLKSHMLCNSPNTMYHRTPQLAKFYLNSSGWLAEVLTPPTPAATFEEVLVASLNSAQVASCFRDRRVGC